MGQETATIVVAYILQRGQHINSAGGYLRALTEKARAGQFSIGRCSWLRSRPMLRQWTGGPGRCSRSCRSVNQYEAARDRAVLILHCAILYRTCENRR